MIKYHHLFFKHIIAIFLEKNCSFIFLFSHKKIPFCCYYKLMIFLYNFFYIILRKYILSNINVILFMPMSSPHILSVFISLMLPGTIMFFPQFFILTIYHFEERCSHTIIRAHRHILKYFKEQS